MIPIPIVVVQTVPQQVTPANHVVIHTVLTSHMIAQIIHETSVLVLVNIITVQIANNHFLR